METVAIAFAGAVIGAIVYALLSKLVWQRWGSLPAAPPFGPGVDLAACKPLEPYSVAMMPESVLTPVDEGVYMSPEKIVECLESAPRLTDDEALTALLREEDDEPAVCNVVDKPEGTVYIRLSDTLALTIAASLRYWFEPHITDDERV